MVLIITFLVVPEDETPKLTCTAREMLSASIAGIPVFMVYPKPGFEYGDDIEDVLAAFGYPEEDFESEPLYILESCSWSTSDQKFYFVFGGTRFSCANLDDYPVRTA